MFFWRLYVFFVLLVYSYLHLYLFPWFIFLVMHTYSQSHPHFLSGIKSLLSHVICLYTVCYETGPTAHTYCIHCLFRPPCPRPCWASQSCVPGPCWPDPPWSTLCVGGPRPRASAFRKSRPLCRCSRTAWVQAVRGRSRGECQRYAFNFKAHIYNDEFNR